MNSEHIYLDHAASTPVREEVIDVMMPYWTDIYGNPSSAHTFGQRASQGLENARENISRILGAAPNEIVFTGCGSESDNIALRGAMMAARREGRGNHLITSIIEHKAVLETAVQLRDYYGFDLTVLPVNKHGQVSPEDVRAALRDDTVLISIMSANNEIGSLQPFLEIGRIATENGILYHTDAIQASATFEWNLSEMPIDLLSLAPHKFYGPKGIGILYVREGIDLVPPLTGGGQEAGRRSGTVNVPFAVGAAEALKLASENRLNDLEHYSRLRDRLISGILRNHSHECILTGHPFERLHNHASFTFRGISGNDLLIHLDARGVSASSGSACLTGDPKPSKTLEALGLDPAWTGGGLRLTVGRQNSSADIDFVLEILPDVIAKIRNLSGKYNAA
jgi:cysteine desulfurase